MFLSAALPLGVAPLLGAEGAVTLVYTDVKQVTDCGLVAQEGSAALFPLLHSQGQEALALCSQALRETGPILLEL